MPRRPFRHANAEAPSDPAAAAKPAGIAAEVGTGHAGDIQGESLQSGLKLQTGP
jgi:hypothetical protein